MLQPLFEVRRYRGGVVTHSHDFHQVVLPLEGRLSWYRGPCFVAQCGAGSSRRTSQFHRFEEHTPHTTEM